MTNLTFFCLFPKALSQFYCLADSLINTCVTWFHDYGTSACCITGQSLTQSKCAHVHRPVSEHSVPLSNSPHSGPHTQFSLFGFLTPVCPWGQVFYFIKCSSSFWGKGGGSLHLNSYLWISESVIVRLQEHHDIIRKICRELLSTTLYLHNHIPHMIQVFSLSIKVSNVWILHLGTYILAKLPCKIFTLLPFQTLDHQSKHSYLKKN